MGMHVCMYVYIYTHTAYSFYVYVCSQVTDTSDRIDYEKLKQQEQIFFYDEIILYEDELADNGTAVFSVKIVS